MNEMRLREPEPAAPPPSGDDACADFGAIFERFESPLLRYVGQVVGYRRGEAEDVVQEAFLRLHRQISEKGMASVRHIPTWIYRVAHNLAIDAIRKRARRRESPQGDGVEVELDRRASSEPGDGGVVAGLGRREAAQVALSELGTLPEHQRAAVTLKILEGMTMKQIGHVLGMAPSNVCYHLNLGLGELSRRMKRRGLV